MELPPATLEMQIVDSLLLLLEPLETFVTPPLLQTDLKFESATVNSLETKFESTTAKSLEPILASLRELYVTLQLLQTNPKFEFATVNSLETIFEPPRIS